MRSGDRTYLPWLLLPLVSGGRVYERVPLDNAVGYSYQIFLSGGAAGTVSNYFTNFDNTMPQTFDADALVNMTGAGAAGVAANANLMVSSSFTQQTTVLSRFLVINFVPSANGFATLAVSVRRYIAT